MSYLYILYYNGSLSWSRHSCQYFAQEWALDHRQYMDKSATEALTIIELWFIFVNIYTISFVF